jgi:hypothetical protein
MGDPTTDPFLQPQLGPWLAAAAVIFDGSLLAYLVAVFIYLPLFGSGQIHRDLFSADGKLSLMRVLILFALASVSASQFVHWVQNFREPALREFADSWLFPLFGCLCSETLARGSAFWRLPKLTHLKHRRGIFGTWTPVVLEYFTKKWKKYAHNCVKGTDCEKLTLLSGRCSR